MKQSNQSTSPQSAPRKIIPFDARLASSGAGLFFDAGCGSSSLSSAKRSALDDSLGRPAAVCTDLFLALAFMYNSSY